MIFVDQAMEDFNTVMGSEGNSCASCHTPEDFEMTRATYPQWDEEPARSRPSRCRSSNARPIGWGWKRPIGYNSQAMRNMSALIASEGRGQVVNVAIDGPAQSVWEQGREIYYTRFGQLELSCANCHEDKLRQQLIRADHLSQGRSTAFPTYRLKQANLVGCTTGSVAASATRGPRPSRVGSPEFVALELYVASRGNGLTIEGPAVRN
jgi:sulfur-oxidizing protein SoxA